MPEPRLVFAGSPEFAAAILGTLLDSPYKPIAVYCQPDRPRGRGRKLQPSPVKSLAVEHDLPVEQPPSLKDNGARKQLAAYQPDIMVVAAYGLLLPKKILQIPSMACLNVHASLLPRWRGAAPIERAAMAGDDKTGICIMHMEAGLDTGPVYRAQTLAIDYNEPISNLEQQLAHLGGQTLLEVIGEFAAAAGKNKQMPRATPQDNGLATYAHKLTGADRQMDWTQPAQTLQRQIWALAERLPVRAWLADTGIQLISANVLEQTQIHLNTAEPGTIVDVTRSGITVQCATDMLQIKQLKLEKGKGKVMDAAAAISGYPDLFRTGNRLGPHPQAG